MLRSLYSGVSGMRTNQVKMDVIGNNIANVNTTGFKSGRARFQDMLSQTLAYAQASTDEAIGGVNAQQVGLGVKVGAIDTIMTNGGLQPTNRDLDFAVEGTGFFIVTQENVPEGSPINQRLYTRDGAFYRDSLGNLVNASGYRVVGQMYDFQNETWPADFEPTNLQTLKITNELSYTDADGNAVNVNLETFSIDSSGTIIGVYDDGVAREIGRMVLAKFENPEGLEKMGNNNYRASRNSGEDVKSTANSEGYGLVRSGVLEMSNVDLANEFTDLIITSRSYQANSRTITTSDEMLQELLSLKR
ncbi:flagellar hook-basal body complex protein [Proteiniclasticum ruminis]|uniref:Flagellar hook protein FlgE n=1 Tax=Proteiniclasticum ruminis TaxID=398199 RepID=A0A1I5C982_9CLOT|nr:flagellar hook-basal body complex protein [Proteiniclasticum ruminis]SFN83436.1 flagellar hook protein FlgE [Proteiniclasticum ruminis]